LISDALKIANRDKGQIFSFFQKKRGRGFTGDERKRRQKGIGRPFRVYEGSRPVPLATVVDVEVRA
jgi:hypothetical protein